MCIRDRKNGILGNNVLLRRALTSVPTHDEICFYLWHVSLAKRVSKLLDLHIVLVTFPNVRYAFTWSDRSTCGFALGA